MVIPGNAKDLSLWLRNLFVFGIEIRNSSLETEAIPTRMTLTSPRDAVAPGGEEEEEEEEEEEAAGGGGGGGRRQEAGGGGGRKEDEEVEEVEKREEEEEGEI